MDIEHCYKILDLDRNASFQQVKEAYKDLVNIWHPDRFSNKPRLKRKAEQKLKEINAAYDTLRICLDTGQNTADRKEPGARGKGGEKGVPRKDQGQERIDRTEAIAEAATRMALTAWVHISAAFHRFVNQVSDASKE